MASPPVIDVGVCERFVNAARHECPAAVTTATVAQDQPEWDALANSFASLSNTMAGMSLLVGVIALLAGVGWGLWVKKWAEDTAKVEAKAHAKALVEEWCRTEAPQIVRRHLDNLQNASLGTTDDGLAADEMGEEAG